MSGRKRAFFLFFFLSGFCGLLYEVIWTRLAMAHFGVTTTVVSVVLSVFMLGLALGSWIAGWPPLLARLRTGRRFLRLYALVELGIGTGAFAVPALFDRGRVILLRLGESDSYHYHLASALLLSAAILPWATLMGTTYALGLGALHTVDGKREQGSFSYLYLANVLGAACGTVVTALALVELLGFRSALQIAAVANSLIAIAAWVHAGRPEFDAAAPLPEPTDEPRAVGAEPAYLVVLFVTGFVAMALELVWTRLYSRYLGTFVYSFAGILTVYLLATYLGSYLYRRGKARGETGRAEILWALLGVFSILPLAFADRRLLPHGLDGSNFTPLTLVGIAPFCATLGYLTPLLVDRYSGDRVGAASRAYSINTIGCIFGPLVAGYLLLPLIGERGTIALLAMLPLAIGLWATLRARTPTVVRRVFVANVVLTCVVALAFKSYAETIDGAVIRRDHVATVVAYRDQENKKRLLVNGVGITSQTTITKVMAHLPLASLPQPPRSALAICFGMGTTFRSLSTWGIHTVAVDLVPSVPALFDYFVPNGSGLIVPGKVEVVIDDGRRYLDRTSGQFDVITIDPPPPVQAAGSSLLYSREFYRAVKRRLTPDGILQQWLPSTDESLVSSVVQSLTQEFPYVRAFGSIEGWGLHFLVSNRPLPSLTAEQLIAKMPPAAIKDLAEWLPEETAQSILASTLKNERAPQSLIDLYPHIVALSDDHPTNEYFILRALSAMLSPPRPPVVSVR